MVKRSLKYIATLATILLCAEMVFGLSAPLSGMSFRQNGDTIPQPDSNAVILPDTNMVVVPAEAPEAGDMIAGYPDYPLAMEADSAGIPEGDSTAGEPGRFLDDIISGHNKDSLVYNVKDKLVFIYTDGDVTYQNKNLQADFMRVNMVSKDIYAYGSTDSTGTKKLPKFTEGSNGFTMDTITYNINSGKAKVKGITTQQGEGYIISDAVKMIDRETQNIQGGRYTTCEDTEHPHFYIQMTRAKMIGTKKVIMGPSYLVFEDVPLYFIGIPLGFFMMGNEKQTGFILPSYGEERMRGFFLQDFGYYVRFNDYIDLSATGSVYSLGSWEATAASTYIKRYKYRGNFSVEFTSTVVGRKNEPNYSNRRDLKISWNHAQDRAARPNSTFKASVDFMTSGYSLNAAKSMEDYLGAQTNSSVSYSKNWQDSPFSFDTNIQLSQNTRDSTYTISFPNVNLNMTRINPLRRRNAAGRERWYEKITVSYSGKFSNTVKAKENELFSGDMFSKMRSGGEHYIPVSTSLSLLGGSISLSPSFNYHERWYFKKTEKSYALSEEGKALPVYDTLSGFYRVFDYSMSATLGTVIYGTYQFASWSPLQALRHTITPNVSFSYTPDFGQAKYGYHKTIVNPETNEAETYSPFKDAMYGVPGNGQNASINFSLQNTLEAKVRSKSDTSGVKRIKLLDDLSFRSSYNFLADSFKLAPFRLSLRIPQIIGNFGLNLNATLDPYEMDYDTGQPIDKLMIRRGKLGRITNTGWSIGYTFNSKNSSRPAANDATNDMPAISPETYAYYADPENNVDPAMLRQMLASSYYDIDIPWSFGFNYSVSYSPDYKVVEGKNKRIDNFRQTLSFNGNITLTPKWIITFSNFGFDFNAKQITPGTFTMARDLHCWDMSFSWIPIGKRQSWNFRIGVKSAMLKDLKIEKHSSFYDNIYSGW